MAGETRSVVVRLSLETAQAIAASKQFGTEFDRALSKAEQRSASTSRAIDQIGGTAGKMALVAGAGLAAVITKAANFDEAMSHVAATGDDARSSLDALREAAIQAGQDTAFSATEAAAGVENLAKAGVSAKDILGGGLKGSLDLAAAGGLEVADAAEVAATALTQFKLQGEDVPHVADLLAAAAGKAQGDVSDMSFALKQSGLVASQMGLSIEETTGTLAAFAAAGLLGSDAGTSFRTMLLRLANPTNESAELMADLGIKTYDAQGNFVGMTAVAGQLQAALQNKTQAERDSALATIFGSDAIRAASVLYEQGASGIDAWTGKVDDAGYAAETAATRMDNLKGDVEQFLGSLETALIGAGEGSQGALRDMVQGATKAVNVFNDLPAPLQSTATALLAVTAVTAGAAWFGSRVVRGVADTREALDDLGVSSGKTGKAMKALGAAGAGLAVLTVAAGAIRSIQEATDESLPGTNALTKQLLELSSGKVGDLGGEFDSLGDSIGRITDKDVTEKFTDFMQTPFTGVFGEAAGLREARTEIEALDDALANLVTQGGPEDAAAAFDSLVEAQELSADQARALRGLLPGYQEALDGVSNSATLAGDATGSFGVKQRQAAAQAKALRNALADEREAARDTAQSFVGLGDSLDDSKTSLAGWIRDLEKQADALRNFRLNAERAAHRGLDDGLIASLKEAGTAGALRMRQLANATDSEIGRANKAWQRGQAEIRRYIGTVDNVPSAKATTVTAKTSAAMAAIGGVVGALGNVHDKTVTLTVNTIRTGAQVGAALGAGQSAVGGTVVDDGGPYSDRFLYLLAPREEVVANDRGQADDYRPVLKAINAGMPRDQVRGMLAGGGTAGEFTAVRGGSPWARSVVRGQGRSGSLVGLGISGHITLDADGLGGRLDGRIEDIATDVARAEIQAERRFDHVKAGR